MNLLNTPTPLWCVVLMAGLWALAVVLLTGRIRRLENEADTRGK